EPTPTGEPEFLTGISQPPGGSSRVIVPTPISTRRAEAIAHETRDSVATAVATPVSAATLTPTPATRGLAANRRSFGSPTPRPTRIVRRRPGGFPTPTPGGTPAAHPTPGGVVYAPPPIRNGDGKWGVGVYKDSNRVADLLHQTNPGVILLMDPSEGWAK